MSFPISRMDLSGSGGAFYTGYGVDYYDYSTPYRYTEDNIPLRNLATRTKYIADRVDDIRDYLDDAINGNIIRGNSDPGTSDPSDNIDTLEKFLSSSHNADGTIKKAALGDVHPPLTLAAGNFSALQLFVGSQRIKLEGGIGNNKVASGSDARFAYFDAVVSTNGSTSRINAPGGSAPYEYYRVQPPAPFIEGLTYYTSLKTALDDGARRILMLEGVFNEPLLGPVYDLGGDDLYLYGIEENQVTVNIPNATLQFNNGAVIFENMKFGGIAGAATIKTIGTAMTLKRTNGTGDVTFEVEGSNFHVEESTVQNLKIVLSTGNVMNSIINNYFTIDGISRCNIVNTEIIVLDMHGNNYYVNFDNVYFNSIIPNTAFLYGVKFEKCHFVASNFYGAKAYMVTWDSCRFTGTFYIGNAPVVEENVVIRNSLLENGINLGVSNYQRFEFTNNSLLGNFIASDSCIQNFNISENYVAGQVLTYHLTSGTFSNNYFLSFFTCDNIAHYVSFECNIASDFAIYISTAVSISCNTFGEFYMFRCNHVEISSNYFTSIFEVTEDVNVMTIFNNSFSDNITFSGSGASLEDMNIVNNKMNGCLLYTSPSPRDRTRSRMPSSA